MPTTRTAAPQPAKVHQPSWLATAKQMCMGPPRLDVAIAPTRATPRVAPTCLEVEAMPAATPAWARGMPETAAFVMGAFTNPNPIPKIAYALNKHEKEVESFICVSIRQ